MTSAAGVELGLSVDSQQCDQKNRQMSLKVPKYDFTKK